MDLFKPSLVFFCLVFFFARPSFQEKQLIRSYELSIINHVNQTGHCTIDFALVQAARGLRRDWRANIKHEIAEDEGLEKHYVTGHITAPPPKPRDYELFPGIGFYKFHTELKTLHEGMSICAHEGGHLMIVNSEDEANVATRMYARYPSAWDWANIGFYDKNGDGNYKTIFGKSLESTGYSAWHPNEPNHSQGPAYCGVIHRLGLLGAGICERARPFICEYDLFWGA